MNLTSWTKEILTGGKLTLMLWIWCGGIIAPFFWAGFFTKTTGLHNFIEVSSFLGLPDGFMTGVGTVENWIISHSILVHPVCIGAAAFALAMLFCGSQPRYTQPSGPAAATFYIALTGGQIAGGISALQIIPSAVCLGALWWLLRGRYTENESFWERILLVLIELFAQAVYIPWRIVSAAFFSSVNEGPIQLESN
ncbi:hypothetical protein [Propionibacterium australiense]|uniref:hypothetical protein n=1 Tax=Propionibacterium australiense TaxID=119981 RepID=UPI000F835537|nr:hypothetical protein [Propionibacterium australiense]